MSARSNRTFRKILEEPHMVPGLKRRTTYAVAAVIPLAAAALAAAAPSTASANPSHARAQLAGSHPSWAKPANRATAVPATKQVKARVYLAPRSQSALTSAVMAVSTPGSATYHHFITPKTYDAQFAATGAQVSAVRSWLTSAGLRVTSVATGNRYVTVTGTSAAAEKAFATHLALFHHAGARRQAPTTALTVPSSVAGSVLGVTGLAQDSVRMKPAIAQPPVFRNAQPCSQYYGQLKANDEGDFTTPLPKFNGKVPDYAVCGYTAKQLRGGYGVTASKLTGTGVTVAIIDAYESPTLAKDANEEATSHGDAAFTAGQFTDITDTPFTHNAACGAPGWSGEQSLDVEAIHGLAPAANIRYYGAKSCEGSDLDDALAQVIHDNKASIVSNSYGNRGEGVPAAEVKEFNTLAQQAALQGITVNFSSGDDGDELAATGTKSADFSASDPFVTAVGGTAIAIGANNTMQFATGWGTEKGVLATNGKSWTTPAFTSGAGGGFSTLFERPSYQNGVVPATAPAGRAVPDIAMLADPTTGMLTGETQKFPNGKNAFSEFRIGGTSLASPLLTGDEADAIQHAGGGRIGFANPQLYALSKSAKAPYLDIAKQHVGDANVRADFANSVDASKGVIYSVRTFGQDSSLVTTKGWDDVTGVGQPTQAFLTALTTGSAG
jgi:subtilase family serine protease